MSCAASLATLKLLRDGLVKNAEVVGAHMHAGVKALMDKHSIIGDVRGRGLMIGVELVRDRQTKERATTERDRIVHECFRRGLLVLGRRSERDPPVTVARADDGSGGHGDRNSRSGDRAVAAQLRRLLDPSAEPAALSRCGIGALCDLRAP